MFERYTEKARRAIFFARYEASQFGSPVIDSEHLLLGLLRESKSLNRWLPKASPEAIRERIAEQTSQLEPTSTSVDLPLSAASKRILKHAAEEADRLNHRHIGTEHLFLGVMDENDCLAERVLREAGADAASIRLQLTDQARQQRESLVQGSTYGHAPSNACVEIHGVKRNMGLVRDAVQRYRMYNLHWDKRAWTEVDIVVARKTGKVSFDLRIAEDTENFQLVKGGWKKGHCVICRWELFQAKDDADHGVGYTNGHDWLCAECYRKFWESPDFFSSPYPDIA